MKIGYARVSTQGQDLSMQLDALKRANCDEIFQEKASGGSNSRPHLKYLLEKLRPGDSLVVWKLDRLGRSANQLVMLAEEFRQRHVHFSSLSDAIDTSGPTGRFFFQVMAAFAEMERELIRERTRAGLAAARARGKIVGRPPALAGYMIEAIEKLIQDGKSIRDIASDFGISVPTIYRYFAVSSLRAK